MSTSIDQRVVQMRFDNRDFERNANATISVLEKLKQKLTLKDSGKALDEFQAKANQLNFDQLSKSSDTLGNALEAKVIAKLTVIQNLVNRVTDAGVRMVKSLSVDQVSSGFNKYEEKLANTQSIMNATHLSLDDVNKQLEKLMWYTDETSYSFSDMANTVGKFTAFDIPLDKAVQSIIGIGNAAGLAGASVQDASHAMQGFAKGIGTYMDRQDWSWISTAHMDTAEFKKQLMETAAAMGVLKKASDGAYTTTKGTLVNIQSFETTLSEKWLSGDILSNTLSMYGEYSEAVYDLYQNGVRTSDAMDQLSGKYAAVSEQGMRAAQESKTFGDAINAVKDAISSGWMQTFEILFGNFEEAKEVWAAVYDELYDIFALSGETRNEILNEWKDLGGREQLFELIAMSWEKIKTAMTAAKGIIDEVFPPITAQRIMDIVGGLKDFVSQLKLSSDATYTLSVLFRTLLLPIKLVTTAITIAGAYLKSFAIIAVKVIDLILSMMSNTKLAEKVFRNIFGDENGQRIFNALASIITGISDGIDSLIGKVIEFKDTFTTSEGFNEFVDSFKAGMKAFKDAAIDGFATVLEAIASGDWTRVFNKILNSFKTAGKVIVSFAQNGINAIKQFLKSINIKIPDIKVPEGLTKIIENFKDFIDTINPFKEALEGAGSVGEKFGIIVREIAGAVVDFTNKINPAKILVFGFGVALINLVIQLSSLFNAMASVTKSFSGIGTSVKGILDAIKNRIAPVANKYKNIGDMFIKIAVSVTILAAALTQLTRVPADKLAKVNVEMMKLIAVIGGASAILAIIDLIGTKLNGASDGIKKFSDVIFAFSVSMVAFAAAMKLMQDTKVSLEAVLGMIAMIGALSIAAGYLGRQKNEFDKGALIIVSFAGAIYVMVTALNRIKTNNLGAKLVTLISIMGMMVLVLKVASRTGPYSRDAIRSMKSLSSSLLLISGVLYLLGKIGTSGQTTIVKGAILALMEILTIMIPMLLLTRVLGKYMKDSMKGLKDLASGIALLVIPIYAFGKMNEETIRKGTEVVRELMAMFGVLSLLHGIVLGIFGGSGKNSFANNMMQFGAAVALLAIPIALIGSLDTESVKRGTIAIDSVIVLLGLVSAIQSDAEKAKTSLTSIVAAVGIFAAAMVIFSLLDWTSIIKGIVAMGAATAALAALFKSINGLEIKSAGAVILTAIGVIAVLATSLLMMRNMEDPYLIVAKLGGLAAVIYALGEATKAAAGIETKGDVKDKIILAAGFVVEAGVAVAALGHLGGDFEKAISNAVAMYVVLKAIGECISEIGDTEVAENVIDQIKLMAGFVVEAGVAVIALGHLGGDPIKSIANAVAMNIVLKSIGECISTIGDTEIKEDIKTKAQLMGWFIAEATGSILLLGNFGGDPLKAIVNSAAVSLIIIAMGGAVKLMNGVDFQMGWQQMLSMSAMILAAAGAVWIIGEAKTEGVLQKAIAMALILGVATGIAEILGHFQIDAGTVGQGLVAVGEVLLGVGIVIGILIGIGELLNKFDRDGQVEAGIERMTTILNLITNMFGKAVGGFFNGIGEGATESMIEISNRIGTFITNIDTAFTNISGVKEEVITKVNSFFDALKGVITASNEIKAKKIENLTSLGDELVLVAPKFVEFSNQVEDFATEEAIAAINGMKTVAETLSILQDITIPDLVPFGQAMSDLAPYITSFTGEITKANIDSAAVEAATNAAQMVASFAIDLGNNAIANGLDLYTSDTPGNGILGRFGAELASFAPNFKTFTSYMSGITEDSISNGLAAGALVVEFAKTLPQEGGVLQWWVGETKTLSAFGLELAMFGPEFAKYAKSISEVSDWSSVENSAKAAKLISDFANDLPAYGGVLQSWFGERPRLSAFGEELASFGVNLLAYSNVVAGVDQSNVENATEAAKKIIDIYAELPTTGGWLDWLFGGDMDFTEFGKQINSLGKALANYHDYVSGLNYDAISKSLTSATLIINLSQNLGNFKKDNVEQFKKDISSFADTGIDEFLTKFEDAGPLFSQAGSVTVAKLAIGVNSSKEIFTGRATDLVNGFCSTFTKDTNGTVVTNAGKALAEKMAIYASDKDTFEQCGADMMMHIQNGVVLHQLAPKEAVISAMASCSNSIDKYNKNNNIYSGLYFTHGEKMINGVIAGVRKKEHTAVDATFKMGQNMVSGIARGMLKQQKAVINTGNAIINSLIKAMQNAAQIKSPSKRTEHEVGDWLIKGIANSFTKDKTLGNVAKDKIYSVIDEMRSIPIISKLKRQGQVLAEAIKEGFESVDLNVTEHMAKSNETYINRIKGTPNADVSRIHKPMTQYTLDRNSGFALLQAEKMFQQMKPVQDYADAMTHAFVMYLDGVLSTEEADIMRTKGYNQHLDSSDISKIRNAISNNYPYEFVDAYQSEFEKLTYIGTIYEKDNKLSTKKLDTMTEMLNQKTERVNQAERDYIEALQTYGKSSKESSKAFDTWAKAKVEYEAVNEAVLAEQEKLNTNLSKNYTVYGEAFLNAVGDTVAKTKIKILKAIAEGEEIGEDFDASALEFVKTLQEDMADGILNNPVVLDAVRSHVSDILDIFNQLSDDINLGYDINDKEYQLWLNTEGLDATETEKLAKKQELAEKKLASSAEKVRVAEEKYKHIVQLFGKDSREAEQARSDMLDAQNEIALAGQDYAKVLYDIQKAEEKEANATKEAADARSEAADEEEEAIEKQKSAREKALEEFEEWKKDGSLDEWHKFGATDEELMDALLKKYQDEEAEQKKREAEQKKKEEERKKQQEEAKKAAQKETEEEFVASGAEVMKYIELYLGQVDNAKIDKAVTEGFGEKALGWAEEYKQTVEQVASTVGTGISNASSGINSATNDLDNAVRTLSGITNVVGTAIEDIPNVTYSADEIKKAIESRNKFIKEYGFNPNGMSLTEISNKIGRLLEAEELEAMGLALTTDRTKTNQDPKKFLYFWKDQIESAREKGYLPNQEYLGRFGNIVPLEVFSGGAGSIADTVAQQTDDSITKGLDAGITSAVGNYTAPATANYQNVANSIANAVTGGIGGDLSSVDSVLQSYIPDENSWIFKLSNFDSWAEEILESLGKEAAKHAGGWAENVGNFLSSVQENGIVDTVIDTAADAAGEFVTTHVETYVNRSNSANPKYYKSGVQTGEAIGDGMAAGIQNRVKSIQETIASAISTSSLFTLLGYGGLGTSTLSKVSGAGDALKSGATTLKEYAYSSKIAQDALNTVLSRTQAASAKDFGTPVQKAPVQYNYTQNNYSPKALSRYDIYRDTRNQLSRIKMGGIS